MPLPAPILDDRSYQQLRDELIRRIPVYAPEWTDHNASDPGITLIELFAFLGENLLYRFNQIPDATKLAFLRLLQLPADDAASLRARRAELYEGSLDHWCDHVTAELEAMHPGLSPEIRRIHVARWGHAMIRPGPGWLFGAERQVARSPQGRVIPCGRVH